MAELQANGNAAPGLTSAAILLLTWSFLSFAVRLWVKLRKIDGWGADDTAISVAFLGTISHVVAVCIAISHGYGDTWQITPADEDMTVEKALYAGQVFYVASIGLTRISVSFFVIRLTRDGHKTQIAKLLTGAYGVLAVACIFAVAIRGDITQPWSTLDGSHIMYVRWLIVELSGLAIEFSLWATATWLIWGLQMPVRKRLSVSALLATRFILVPMVALRLLHLSPSNNLKSTNPSIAAAIYTEIVLEVSFMLSSITCAKPFLRPFHSGYFISTTNTKTSGYLKGGISSLDNSYRMLSAAKSNAGSNYSTSASGHSHPNFCSYTGNDDAAILDSKPINHFRPQPHSHRATVSADILAQPHPSLDSMVISRTKAWTLTYEEANQCPPQTVVTKK